jgi:hypothetical protein
MNLYTGTSNRRITLIILSLYLVQFGRLISIYGTTALYNVYKHLESARFQLVVSGTESVEDVGC